MKKPSRSRTKLTKSGRIMGRPPGGGSPGYVKIDRPVTKVRLTGEAPPKAVISPVTGEIAAAHGPRRPIYEQREGANGRWGQTTDNDTLWIIRAIEGRGRRDYAKGLAEQIAEDPRQGKTCVAAVKRKLTRTRAEIRATTANQNRIRKLPRGISDIPPESE